MHIASGLSCPVISIVSTLWRSRERDPGHNTFSSEGTRGRPVRKTASRVGGRVCSTAELFATSSTPGGSRGSRLRTARTDPAKY
jgi:hypothetical protein